MNLYEILSFLFVSVVIVLIAIGAINAFRDFFSGRHHERAESDENL
ncbi:MAG: hypothetical protein U9P14_01415 [Gemmatimonadota bacterium]|nr:hypothetical protein [Gemmatimonadota bacterium]